MLTMYKGSPSLNIAADRDPVRFMTVAALLALLVLIVLCPLQLGAQSFNKSGRTAFQFVKIGIGARQAALGEAAISEVRDINGVFWNPANITGVENGEASFTYTRWLADLNYYSGAAGFRWPGVGVIGLSYASLSYGDLEEALVSSPTGSSDTRTGNTFTGGDLMVGVSFAHEFTDQLSIGATAKYLQEKLFEEKVDIVAYDVGTNYSVGYKGIRIAMSAQNFGPSVSWLAQSDRPEGYDIPLYFRMGVSANLVGHEDGFVDFGSDSKVLFSVDAIHTNDYGDRLHMGAEYWFGDFLAVRGGYRFNYEEGNLSFGLGLNQTIAGNRFRVDYAYVSYEFLNSPHRLTVSFDF